MAKEKKKAKKIIEKDESEEITEQDLLDAAEKLGVVRNIEMELVVNQPGIIIFRSNNNGHLYCIERNYITGFLALNLITC